ncbi:MAG: molybdopterin cofactor-binding domain-containing protein [Pseudomonadota bacterium]
MLQRPTKGLSESRLGVPAQRVEDLSLLTGAGRYADDLAAPIGAQSIAFVRAPEAHARIVSIDASKALAMKGVCAVVDGATLAQKTKPFIGGVKSPIRHFSLAVDKIRYFGEPVCIVVAENRYVAEDAAEAVEVAYESLPAVVDPQAALIDDAPVLHEALQSNLAHDRQFVYGEPDAAFKAAAHIVKTQIKYPRNSCTPIECFHVTAEYNPFEDSYQVTANFQGPFTIHPVMARALGVPGNRLRLKTPPDSGGSYGVKQAVFPYIVACCVAAKESGKPVRWVEDRFEHLAAATSATNRVVDIEAAVDVDGRINALRYDQIEDCGAFLRAPEPATLYRIHGNLNGAYDIEHLAVRNRVAVTNKTPTGLVRGFGGPQVYFALERLVDKIAKTLDLDPVEVRALNAVKTEQMPYRTASGALLDSGDYHASIERAKTEGGYADLIARRDAARREGRIYGVGCAMVVEPSVSNMGYITALLTPEARRKSGPKNGGLATASVSFDPSGSITVKSASAPQGQGHRTVLAQVVGEVFSLNPDEIVVASDHDTVKDVWSIASGNYSSRFAAVVAGAAHIAAVRLRDKIAKIAASQLNVKEDEIEFFDGAVHAASNPDNALPLARIASAAHWSPLSMPDGVQSGLSETATWTMDTLKEPDEDDRINSSGAYGFIFDFCGVEIDPVTGAVEIDRYVTMHDAGRLLNPLLADGQIKGGFAHGLGAALLEEFSYGPDGSFLAGTLADYLMPTACETPRLTILHDETPSPFTPLGAKGIGEGNCMSTPVCVANAVSDALGVEDVVLPLTRSRVSEMLFDEPEPDNPNADASTPQVPKGEGRGVTGAGSTFVPADATEVWALILDERALASVIPGCDALKLVGPGEYEAVMTIGAGPIRGQFDVDVALKDLDEPRALTLAGGAVGPLGRSRGEGRITLETVEGGTNVNYQYSVLVSGKAASIGGRLLDGATRSFISLFFKQLTAQLGDKSGAGFLATLIDAVKRLLGRAP